LGKNGDIYECGRDSAAVLSELTRGRRVECTQRDVDRYSRVVAVCRTESGELNMAMVRRGWAVDYTKYSGGRYQSEEQQARREQLGIWAGRFEVGMAASALKTEPTWRYLMPRRARKALDG